MRGSTLFACGDTFTDHFSLARSDDMGQSFSPLLSIVAPGLEAFIESELALLGVDVEPRSTVETT